MPADGKTNAPSTPSFPEPIPEHPIDPTEVLETNFDSLSGKDKARLYRTIRMRDRERVMTAFGSTWENVLSQIETGEEENLDKIASKYALISFDEKPGIQAIRNVVPDRPPIPGQHPSWERDHEYQRLGTFDVLAGIDLVTGHACAYISLHHTASDYVKWLEEVDRFYPPDTVIVILEDNLSSHQSNDVINWLRSHPGRFEFVFLPVHASWLNAIEQFFSALQRALIKAMRVGAMTEAFERVKCYMDKWNNHPYPIDWSYGCTIPST